MAKHAQMSPSGAERWVRCPGSVPLSADLPDESSKFADEGSCAHEVAALCLTEKHDAAYYIGRVFHETEVAEDMAEHVNFYVQTVHDYMTDPTDDLHVEVRLPITSITGEADAFGTADAVILSHMHQEITVIDLKFGKGVKVHADQNLQLAIYALAVLAQYAIVGDWKTVRMVIIQPRVGGNHECN